MLPWQAHNRSALSGNDVAPAGGRATPPWRAPNLSGLSPLSTAAVAWMEPVSYKILRHPPELDASIHGALP